MKKVLLSIAICLLAINAGFAQYEDEFFAQPTHIVGKRINAAGEITRVLESDFSYNEEGKVVSYAFPDYHLTASYAYNDDYLFYEGFHHDAGHPYFTEGFEYSYNNGRIKHITHSWDQMNAPQNWEYSYDEEGRLKQKDFCEGYTVEYHEHYIYDYENEGRTKTESYWTSWVTQGMKLRKRTVNQYDDDFNLFTVHTETYNLDGDITSNTMVTYAYTPAGKEESQIKQTFTEGEWVNTSIQRFIYDEYDRVIEQQNGSWSAENDDWDINKKITFIYEPQEGGLICTVSFYKKDREEWGWDVFGNQTILFGPQLKIQQKTLRFYVYEDMNDSGNINQFEFTYSYTPEPIYLDIEEKESLVCDLYPNPSTSIVSISGNNLKLAKVFNTLGQCLATVRGKGERLTVDLSSLPAGIYFVTVTNVEGRKCVRKVVKE
jgi:YD repeat-containing protein